MSRRPAPKRATRYRVQQYTDGAYYAWRFEVLKDGLWVRLETARTPGQRDEFVRMLETIGLAADVRPNEED